MIRAESCQFGKNLYMYPGERSADTLKQTELPLSFNDRVKTKDVMRSSVPANGESGLKTSDALKEEEYIRYLESFFPGRSISVADLSGKDSIKDYALSHKGSFQIVISRETLERMQKDPEFEKKCMEALKSARQEQAGKLGKLPSQGKHLLGCGLVLDKDGEVTQWVLSQKDIQPKPVSNSSGIRNVGKEDGSYFRIRTEKGTMTIEKKKLRYVPAKDLVKIARAGNRQAVRRTISGIQAQINQLKSGSGDRRTKAVLVKQAEQVLLKAKLKDKLLKKEEILQLQQKKAAKKAEYEKTLRLKLLLKKKREGRKVREYGQIRDYYETPQERRLEKELEKYENSVETDTTCQDQSYGSYGAAAGMGPSAGGADISMAGGILDITV